MPTDSPPDTRRPSIALMKPASSFGASARECVTEIVSWRTRVFMSCADVIGRLLDRYPLRATDA